MSQAAIQYVAVAVFAVAGVVIAWRLRIGLAREIAWVSARAVAQLVVVGLLLTVVFRYPLLSIPFVLVMLTTATLTAARRLRPIPGAPVVAAAAVALPAMCALGLLLLAGAFDIEPRGVIPAAGILIGGAMAAVGVAGRSFVTALGDRRGEVETRLSLGDPAADALRPLAEGATRVSLIPVLDQTRSVGLVTLPGTFVGLVLGGASPAEAARLQLLVLVALVVVELVAARLATELAARRCTLTGERVIELPAD